MGITITGNCFPPYFAISTWFRSNLLFCYWIILQRTTLWLREPEILMVYLNSIGMKIANKYVSAVDSDWNYLFSITEKKCTAYIVLGT